MAGQIKEAFKIIVREQNGAWGIEAQSPSSEQVTTALLPPFDQWLIPAHRDTLAMLRKGVNPSPTAMESLGRALHNVLFSPDIATIYANALTCVGNNDLRLCLQIEPPELAALPWEAMYDGKSWLAERSNTPLVRRLHDNQLTQSLQVRGPLRILFAAASPTNLASLPIGDEIRHLHKILKPAVDRYRIIIDKLINVTYQQLKEALFRKDYHILCFSGHGSANAIFFDDGQKPSPGEPYSVTAMELAKILEGQRTMRLVFLAACDTAAPTDSGSALLQGFAQELTNKLDLPAVLAMQYKIGSGGAADFTATLLTAIAAFLPLDVAFTKARGQLGQLGVNRDFVAPVLYLNTEESRIFEARPLTREALFDELIANRRHLFAGRDTELNSLREFMTDPVGGYLVVTAPAGFGKTTLMANLVDRDSLANAYHFFNAIEAPGSLDPVAFFRNIVEVMAEWHQYRTELPQDVQGLYDRYHQLITQALDRPRTLVLDGLDEVPWSEIQWNNFSRLLAGKLPTNMHIIATVRDVGQDWDKDIITRFVLPTDQTRCYRLEGLRPEQVKAVFQKAGGQAESFAENPISLGEIMRVAAYDPNQPLLGADPFFVAFLAKDAADGDLKPGEISTQPAGLDAYLDRWLTAVRQSWGAKDKRDQAVFDLFGTLAVARGPLSRTDLEIINKSLSDDDVGYFGDVVNKVRRLVQGKDNTGYSLLHPRLRNPLEKTIRNIEMYRGRLLDYCGHWKNTKSHYALGFYARHLAEQAQASNPAEQHRFTEQLVRLVVDPIFQQTHKSVLGDPAALRNDLDHALRAAAQDDDLRSLPLLVESAQALMAFDQHELRPEPIFTAAENGDVDIALHHLSVFNIDSDWREVARLLIAWLAVPRAKETAHKLRDEIVRETPVLVQPFDPAVHDPLPKMLAHLDAALGIAASPLLLLPPTPTQIEVEQMLASMKGAGIDSELLARLPSAQVRYLTEQYGLPLVAFANAHPPPGIGDRYFSQYVGGLAGYGYTEYRNNSLWYLLDAVLHHPHIQWGMDNARTVVSNALGESQVRWRGSLPLTVLALQSSVGNLGASSQLQKYIEEVAGEADAIIGNKIEEKDIWGSLRRCLAAIAEVQTYVLASSKEADASLKRAIKLRYGFAGFKVPACLNIGEAILICQPGGSDEMGKEITDTVLSAAHNIQDPVFCARSTARADAMIGQLWKTTGPGTSLAQIIANFVKDPFAPDFATLHRIGGGKKYPKRDDSNSKYPLPEVMKTDKGITLSKLAAEVYHCPIFELRRLNPKYQPDILLSSDKPMFIRIPDAGFAPWLAARFAAEALVLPDVRDEERVWLIKGLVPIAAPDPTALDTVLARLLLTTYPLLKAHPERDGLISALAAAAGGLHRPMGHVLPQGIILP